ncbi:MAG: copper chaperone PCu(A)C [Parvibaculum sp.]
MRSMISKRLAAVLGGFALVGACLMGASGVEAQDYMAGQIEIAQPWARPSTVNTGAAYFRLTNTGASDDVLISVASDVAARVELHSMTMDGNIMRMRKEDSLPLPAGKSVSIEPGGLHIMLIGLKQPLVEGETFPMHLTFEKAGGIDITVHVQGKPPVVSDAAMPQGEGQMDDHSMPDMPDMSGSMSHP